MSEFPTCRALRFKGYFVYTEEPPPPAETETAVYWCVKTMSSVGPDSDAVHRTFCDGTRSCYEGPQP